MPTADPALFPSRFRSPLGRLPHPAEPRPPAGLLRRGSRPSAQAPCAPEIAGIAGIAPLSPLPPLPSRTPLTAARAASTRQNSDWPRPFPRVRARAIFSAGSCSAARRHLGCGRVPAECGRWRRGDHGIDGIGDVLSSPSCQLDHGTDCHDGLSLNISGHSTNVEILFL